MIDLQTPELLLLALPILAAYWRWGRVPGVSGFLRGAILLCLLLAMAGPRWNLGGLGQDLLIVIDRSRSMRESARDNIRELITNLENHRGRGDRIGIIGFAANTLIERPASETESFSEFTMDVQPDGSDLHEAVQRTLALADPNRPTRLLLFSDGEYNGPDPRVAARIARDQRIPIDVRPFPNEITRDAAIEQLILPAAITPEEPFSYALSFASDHEVEGTLRIHRGGQLIESRPIALPIGQSRFSFSDRLEEPGFVEYSARLIHEDTRPQNNVAAGLLRVSAKPRILLLNQSGEGDHLARVLESAAIPVDIARPTGHALTQDALDPYAAVILEDVAADDLGRLRLEQLAQFVIDLGGGLLMTGGQNSFATGGYHNSPLEPLLPLELDLNDHNHQVAIAIVLDRSGSMSAQVTENVLKMDLANQGAIETVRLLDDTDQISVIAVDTEPHVIVPLSAVTSPGEIIPRISAIKSAAGGIFIETALIAASAELENANPEAIRHVILFADATDSERPGRYKELLRELQGKGITVSVIGLGTESDSDAELLRDIAAIGNGSITFTTDAQELPRIFSQRTIDIARTTFLIPPPGQTFPGRLHDQARWLGDFEAAPLPSVGGYNLTRLKDTALLAAESLDSEKAPWSAFWHSGLGRVAAVTFQADGQFTGPFGEWPGYEGFFLSHIRWLIGEQHNPGVFVDVERRGLDAHVRVELGDNPDLATQPPELRVIPPGSGYSAPLAPDLTWIGPQTLEGHFRMHRVGSYRPMIKLSDQQSVRGPAVTLPYSPEYLSRWGEPAGEDVLKDLAQLSGGIVRTDVLSALSDPPPSRGSRSLFLPLLITALSLFLLEIAGRRFGIWSTRPRTRQEIPAPEDQEQSWRGRRRSIPAEPSVVPPTEDDSKRRALDEIFSRAKARDRR